MRVGGRDHPAGLPWTGQRAGAAPRTPPRPLDHSPYARARVGRLRGVIPEVLALAQEIGQTVRGLARVPLRHIARRGRDRVRAPDAPIVDDLELRRAAG